RGPLPADARAYDGRLRRLLLERPSLMPAAVQLEHRAEVPDDAVRCRDIPEQSPPRPLLEVAEVPPTRIADVRAGDDPAGHDVARIGGRRIVRRFTPCP